MQTMLSTEHASCKKKKKKNGAQFLSQIDHTVLDCRVAGMWTTLDSPKNHASNIEVLFLCISVEIIAVLMLGSLFSLQKSAFSEVKLSRTVKYRLKDLCFSV